MSVYDLPRLHLAGTAVTRLPTGPRSGWADLTTLTATTDEGPWPADRTPAQFHRWLRDRGGRFSAEGARHPDGEFSEVTGWNLGGNGHFWIDAEFVACERENGRIRQDDAVVGRAVDVWGHHNDYLATTANRARILDIDPASPWTTSIMVGRLAFGRRGRSHDQGYMCSAEVNDVSPPRRRHSRHVLVEDGRPFGAFRRQSVVYQFTADAGDGMRWFEEADESTTVTALRAMLQSGEAHGLTVQLALCGMAAPVTNNAPDRWHLRGTIAPWVDDELRTVTGGRMLTAHAADVRPPRRVQDVSLRVGREHVVLNAVDMIAHAFHGAPDARTGSGRRVQVGELSLRTVSGRTLAVIGTELSSGVANDLTSGILTVPRVDGRTDDPAEKLSLHDAQGTVLLAEEEHVLHVDHAAMILDHPAHRPILEQQRVVEVRGTLHGRPAPVEATAIPIYDPAACPSDELASAKDARIVDRDIVEVAVVGAAGKVRDGWATDRSVSFTTDEHGQARLRLRGVAAGAARVLLRPRTTAMPWNPWEQGSAWAAADVHDETGYWPSASTVAVRVLPDHRHLETIAEGDVTFALLLREVFAYYENFYSFMADEIMSLSDEALVGSYARLIWLMAAPEARDRTWYMPSTREMTGPQTQLLRAFLNRMEASRPTRTPTSQRPARKREITDRGQLDAALRQAATIELAVTIQYLYAMWSLPSYHAGAALVREGRWDEGQLALVCGSGPHNMDGGLRGILMGVAREEMIHFLVVNNIIRATGQPFYMPHVDFGSLNAAVDGALDFGLERLGPASLARFVELEKPFGLVLDDSDLAGPDAQCHLA